jgi:mono/diheme cytochrome c family protein
MIARGKLLRAQRSTSVLASAVLGLGTAAFAQTTNFHGAPSSAAAQANPAAGKEGAEAGHPLFQQICAACHGAAGQGNGNVPALATGAAQTAKDGEIFWFITRGEINNGMPAFGNLPEQQRWQTISYVKSLGTPGGGNTSAASAPDSPDTASASKSQGRSVRSPSQTSPNPSPPTPPATVLTSSPVPTVSGPRLRQASRSSSTPPAFKTPVSSAPLRTATSSSPKPTETRSCSSAASPLTASPS